MVYTPNTDTEFAPAKINLCLHVTGRRADGYHLLESAVAFADIGDHLTLTPADNFALSTTGPFAHVVPEQNDLVTRAVVAAANAFGRTANFHLTLEKNIPAQAGMGGGSADAAAALRLAARAWHITDRAALSAIALTLGADVPACLISTPLILRGIGDDLAPVSLPRHPAVLIWPGTGCDTAAVFGQFGGHLKKPAAISDIWDWIQSAENDLQPAAQKILPVIKDVIHSLNAQPGIHLARMTGSGSGCFGLFDTVLSAQNAASRLQAQHTEWWVKHGWV